MVDGLYVDVHAKAGAEKSAAFVSPATMLARCAECNRRPADMIKDQHQDDVGQRQCRYQPQAKAK